MKDAIYVYQELIEVYGRTPKLLNLHAAALLLVGRYSEAESVILDAIQTVPQCLPTFLSPRIPRMQRLSPSLSTSP